MNRSMGTGAGAAESWHESKLNASPWSTTEIWLGRSWHPLKRALRLLLCSVAKKKGSCFVGATVLVLLCWKFCAGYFCAVCPPSLPFISSEELPDDGLIFANAAYVLFRWKSMRTRTMQGRTRSTHILLHPRKLYCLASTMKGSKR